MESEILNMMIVNLPNFVFAGLGFLIFYRVMMAQQATIDRVISDCLEDNDRD